MPKHPKRRTRRNLAVLALSALCLTGFLYWDNTALQVTRFDPVFSDLPAGFDGCRIVVLSDLHGASFGAHNADLLAAVAAEQPEYIFFLGDLEDKYRGPEDGYPAETARGLSAIAPTYYVTGNHEWAVGGVPALKEILTANGVTVLSNQFVPLERNGDTITLAGIDDPNGRRRRRNWPPRSTPPAATPSGSCWPTGTTGLRASTACWGRIWCAPAMPTAASSACPGRTGCSPMTWTCFPPIPPGCMKKTAPCCSSPGAWGIPGPPSGCSTARKSLC